MMKHYVNKQSKERKAHRRFGAMADDAGTTSRTEESGPLQLQKIAELFSRLACSRLMPWKFLTGLEGDDDLFEYLELKRKEARVQ